MKELQASLQACWEHTRVGIASDSVGLLSEGHRLVVRGRGDGGVDVELHDDELRPVPPPYALAGIHIT